MRKAAVLLCLLVALSGGSAARADQIPFSYNIESTKVFNNNNALDSTSFQVIGLGSSTTGSASPQLLPFILPTGSPKSLLTDSFSNVPISLSVTITDADAKGIAGATATGTVTFTGFLSGTLATHSGPPWSFNWSANSESITLGAPGDLHTYTVSAPFFIKFPLGVPGVEVDIQAQDFTSGGGSGNPVGEGVAATPEPTGLVLAGLALPALLLARRWRPGLLAR